MTRRVAILGGGMAGVAAAWWLSQPGWRSEFSDITIYQRGGRLGGKGASSRATHGRVEEHGLHIWLGYYDNAFRLLRECYEELDRATHDPECPIRTIEDALKPSVEVGLEALDERGEWHHWLGTFATNDLVPGDPTVPPAAFGGRDLVRRALRLLGDFYDSVDAPTVQPSVSMSADPQPPVAGAQRGAHIGLTVLAGAIEVLGAIRDAGAAVGLTRFVPLLDDLLGQVRDSLVTAVRETDESTRMWHLVSVVLAQVRGMVAEGLLDQPAKLRQLNEVDYRDWVVRHGAAPEAAAGTLVSGLYDLVFGFEAGDPARRGFGAGLGVFLGGKTFFDYKGAIFWKMQAGMGDVVFAPLHQALVRRGVRIEYFHRVDDLHTSPDGEAVESVTMGRQVRLAPGIDQYEPLVHVGGLPCFPASPLTDQLLDAGELGAEDLESHWCQWPDSEARTLRRGVDYDDLVFAIPPGMARLVTGELMDARPEWRSMVDGLGTVATQALQVWLRDDEPTLGWDTPGSTMSGYLEPFDTWASMPQLIDREQWPDDDRPGTIAYFCNTLPTPEVPPDDPEYPRRRHAEVRANAAAFLDDGIGHLLPGAVGPTGFRWDQLCGGGEATGEDRLDSQFWRANVDPSDLYVQSLPGTDQLRLRADESGFEDFYVAGDWTDNGLNAGCIEAAVLSGLQAANAVRGRPRSADQLGTYLI